jgi:hypothetical protein
MNRFVLLLALPVLVIATDLRAQAVPPPAAPNPYAAEERLSARGRSDWLLARGARKALERGYRPQAMMDEKVTEFDVRGPSQVVPPEALGTTVFQLRRACTPVQRRSVSNCVRFDVVELFTVADSGAPTSGLRVVPHTFIGPSLDSLYEVGATADVEADAGVVARSVAGLVIPAMPWPIPTRTPDDATPRNP